MSSKDHRLISRDGRALSVQEAGDPAGKPVLHHHGTPGSRLLFSGWSETAERLGIRLISYDRAGYGLSDRHEGRRIVDAAGDVADIARQLEIRRLGVSGLSGGGPHALACAAQLEELVPRVVAYAAVAPFDAEGLDWYADTGDSNVEETELFLSDRAAARRQWEADAQQMRSSDKATLEAEYASIYSELDLATMQGAFGDYLHESMLLGLAISIEGPWDDQGAFVTPWGFDVSEIRTPVRLRQGRQDLMVPYGHGAWLAEHIPSVEAYLSEDESHLSIMRHLEEDLIWLAEAL